MGQRKRVSEMIKRLENNIIKLYGLSFLAGFQILMPIFVPLLQRHGLSMTQVLQTQAAFSLTVVLFELPSGYLADLWGRKNTLILGKVLSSFGFVALLSADSFSDYLLAEFVLGIAMSFISGSDIALLYDSCLFLERVKAKANAVADNESRQDSNLSSQFASHLGNLMSTSMLASAIAAALSSLLMLWSFESVLVAQVFVSLGALLLALSLFEPPIKRMRKQSHTENFSRIINHLLFSDRFLVLIFMALIAYSMASFYAVWLIQKYWQLIDIPVAYFGLLWAVLNIAGSLSAKFAYRFEKRLGSVMLLLICALLPVGAYLGMAFSVGVFGIACGLAFFIARGISMVILKEGLNSRVPSEFRATAMSMNSLGFRAVFILTAPLVGFVVDDYGLSQAFLLLAFVFALVLGALIVPIARSLMQSRNTYSRPEVVVK